MVAKIIVTVVRITVAKVVILGWYYNEKGSYVRLLRNQTVSIAETI